MIRKLVNGKAVSVTSAAVVLSATALVSKIMGVFRNRILAGEFGAGSELDIYYAAFRVPDFIFNIIVLGALSAGFIPIFARLVHEKRKEEAFRTANIVLNLIFLVLIFLFALSIVFTSSLIDLIAPGFSADRKETAAELTRIMFLSPIFLFLSSVVGGILQSFRRFFIYSLSPIMYNIGIIIGAVYFVKWFGIHGLAWGVVLGSFLHFAIQIPIALKLGFSYKWIIDIKDLGVRKMVKMMAPRTLTLVVSQINFIIITAIASTLAVGSLAVFNFANDLQSFPLGLFAISFAVASFPTLSSLSKNKEEFAVSLTKTTKQILFFIIPSSVLFIVLREQIVRVILETGKFSLEDTVLTLDAFQAFSVSLFAQSLIPLFSRAFWAVRDAKTPFIASLVAATVNLLLALSLSKQFGVAGLAGSFSAASVVNVLLLYYAINKKIGFVCHRKIFRPVVKITVSSITAGTLSYTVLVLTDQLLDIHTFAGIFVQGLSAGFIGIAIYCFVSWKLKIGEFMAFRDLIIRRIFKTKIRS